MFSDFCEWNEESVRVSKDFKHYFLLSLCSCNGLIILCNLSFMIPGLVWIFIIKAFKYGKPPAQEKNFYIGHNIRWFISLFISLLFIFEICDGCLGEYYSVRFHIHNIVTPVISWLSTIIALYYYHQIETKDLPASLCILLFYWPCITSIQFFKFLEYKYEGLTMFHMRVLLCLTVTFLYATLVICEFLVLLKKKYLCGKRNFESCKPQQIDFESDDNDVFKSNEEAIIYKHLQSSFLSKITYFWILPILITGFKKPLEMEDLGQLPTAEKVENHYMKLQSIFNQYKTCKTNLLPMWKCYFKFVGSIWIFGGFLKLVGDLVSFINPLAIKLVINYVQKSQQEGSIIERKLQYFPTIVDNFENGFILCVVILISALVQSTLSQTSSFISIVEGIRLKVAMQACVYKKALRIPGKFIASSCTDEKKTGQKLSNIGSGAVVNLISEDSQNIMAFFWQSHLMWAIPIKIFALLVLLNVHLGYSSLVGALFSIFTLTPLQFYIGKKMSNNQNEIMVLSDERIRKTSEFLQGMKVFKLNAWENFIKDNISAIRNKELNFLFKDSMYFAVCAFFTQASVILVALVTFGLFSVVEGKSLIVADVFTGLALFNQIMVPLFLLPVTVKDFINAKESTKRLTEFFSLPEVVGHQLLGKRMLKPLKSSSTSYQSNEHKRMRKQSKSVEMDQINKPPVIDEENEDQFLVGDSLGDTNYTSQVSEISDSNTDCSTFDYNEENFLSNFAIKIENGSFSWASKNDKINLKNIELCIPKGKLTVIVGPTGSGKTSLLSAILGELACMSGSIKWDSNSSIAYVPQNPWLLNSTLRENILFGHGFALRRYETVLRACALDEELQMIGCDDVEIGDKGINLSGGQKQRVCIARALYSTANVIILDDSFSALDSEIGLHVFQEAIQKLLIKRNKTVILVTHRFQFLNQAHQIIVLEDGMIKYKGHIKHIEAQDPELYKSWNQAVCQEEENLKEQIGSLTSKEREKLAKLMTKNELKLKSKRSIYRMHTVEYNTRPRDTDKGPSFKASMRRLLRTHSLSRASRYTVSCSLEPEKVISTGGIKQRPASCSKVIVKNPTSFSCSDTPQTPVSLCFDEDLFKQSKEESKIKQSVFHLKQLLGSQAKKSLPLDCEMSNKQGFRPPLLKKVSTLSGMSNTSIEDIDEVDLSEFGKLLEMEERNRGKISKSLYLQFIKSCGYTWVLLYFLFAIGSQTIKVLTDFWLKSWASSAVNSTEELNSTLISNGEYQLSYNVTYYLGFYVLLSVLSIVTALFTNILCQYAGACGRDHIHRSMLESLCSASMRFFDVTHIGSILNRCSSDMGVIDKKLTSEINKLVYFVFLCCSALVINAVVSPWFLVVVLPFIGIYFFVQKFFIKSSRELQRMESISRTPIYSWFSESLSGIYTIRAYSQQYRFFGYMMEILDTNNNIFLLLEAGNRWLGIVLDYLGSSVTFIAALMAIAFAIYMPERVDLGLVGLSMNYTLLVPMYLIWVVRCWSNTQIYMNAIERVQHYLNICPEEEEELCQNLSNSRNEIKTDIARDWPTSGTIDFMNLSACYDEILPPVLHKIKLHIKPLERVAVCGRSGSGKSTLIMSLFRIPIICEGAIYIDGVDITAVPLRQLRSKLSIVPQEPFLFSGTIRENLDPGNDYDDESAIWKCLELVKMKSVISEFKKGIHEEIRECGSAFSNGQRQLLCLARAILRKSKVIIMDEPTSSVDPETELIMNSIISEAFKNRTIITIAHRISTIMNYDKVVILERGHIVEYGPPQVLKFRKNGVFADMFAAALKKEDSVPGN